MLLARIAALTSVLLLAACSEYPSPIAIENQTAYTVRARVFMGCALNIAGAGRSGRYYDTLIVPGDTFHTDRATAKQSLPSDFGYKYGDSMVTFYPVNHAEPRFYFIHDRRASNCTITRESESNYALTAALADGSGPADDVRLHDFSKEEREALWANPK